LFGGLNMYCFTKINHLMCVFNELILWTEISKEHPVFIRTFAGLTDKNLSSKTLGKLEEVNLYFSKLQEKSKILKTRIKYGIKIHCSYINSLREYIDEFLLIDRAAVSVYREVMDYGKNDNAWQTLVEHIIEEQSYMFEVFKDLKEQMK